MDDDKNSTDADQVPTLQRLLRRWRCDGAAGLRELRRARRLRILKKQGIDVKGKIVIARYGGSWRGIKPKVAQEHGAVGCLIYSDPRDDGYFQGDVYPKGAYRPADGVQRGSVLDMALYPGDPLSPGWASEPGAKRLALSEAKTLMKIPVMPISYGTRRRCWQNLDGPVAPEGLARRAADSRITSGPGATKVHLKVDDGQLDASAARRDRHAFRAASFRINGLLYGNHHDAWVHGASDPLSGAAPLMETARALRNSRKQGLEAEAHHHSGVVGWRRVRADRVPPNGWKSMRTS